MGAPTGSFDVSTTVDPLDKGCDAPAAAKPEIAIVAVLPMECFFIRSHAFASGDEVWADSCSAVSFGSSLVDETHRWSISPMLGRSPRDSKCMGAEPSVK